MKHYLLLFRDQAFSASIALFKRIFGSSFIAMIFSGLIIFLVVMPLTMLAIGYSAFDMLKYQQDLVSLQEEIVQSGASPQDMLESYMGLFHFNFGLLVVLIFVALLLYSWMTNLIYQISDNEIRSGSPNFMMALKQSFNFKVILTIVGFFVLFALIEIASMLIFVLLMSLVIAASKAFGILLLFIGFLFMFVFYLRFCLAIPAIIHGKMGITTAISFSLSNINWKRGWMIFLLGIITFIIMAIVSYILLSIFGADKNPTFASYLGTQAVSLVMNAFFLTYLVAATSTLYFRYSSDEVDEDDMQQHIIQDNP